MGLIVFEKRRAYNRRKMIHRYIYATDTILKFGLVENIDEYTQKEVAKVKLKNKRLMQLAICVMLANVAVISWFIILKNI